MNQIILKITEGTDFELMPPLLQKIRAVANIVWPEARMVNTIAVDGYQLILIMTSVDGADLEGWLTEGYPIYDQEADETNLIPLGLDWEVIAIEGEKIDQSLILPFMAQKPVLDEDGEVIDYEAVTDVTGKLQHWSGHRWAY